MLKPMSTSNAEDAQAATIPASAAGSPEVYPQLRCVWLTAFERAESQGRSADLQRLRLPIDQRLWGESSWIRYWQGRDEELWTDAEPLGAAGGHHPAWPAGSGPAALAGPGASGA
jgi:hypothetical protein